MLELYQLALSMRMLITKNLATVASVVATALLQEMAE